MLRRFIYTPTIVQILLLLNFSGFMLLFSAPMEIIENFALWPLGLTGQVVFDNVAPRFQLWQLVSYAFLHGGLFHLFFNLFALWIFGSRIEQTWGSKAFLLYYFVSVIGAALVQLLVSSQAASSGDVYPTLGASGGVFGLLLAFALTFPNEKLMLLFPPVIIKAKWFVLIYAGVELYAGVTGTLAGIAHFAHLGGMLFGFLLLWYWSKHPLQRP